MAKRNDMPELNSAKVFLTTLFTNRFKNLFTTKYHKLPGQRPLAVGNNVQPRYHTPQTFLQGTLPAPIQNGLPGQHRDCFENMSCKMKALHVATPDYFGLAAVLSGDSDINNFTVYGLSYNSCWRKDELMGFAKSMPKAQS